METLAKADIFFFITAIAVVILSAAFAVVLVYIIRILKRVDEISERVKKESDAVMDEVASFRQNLKEEGLNFNRIISLFSKKSKRKNKN